MAEDQNGTAESFARIPDENRAMHPRKKRPSDNPETQKERNKKWMNSESSKQRGRLEFYYTSDEDKLAFFNKMDKIKIKLGQGKVSNTSTFNALNSVFDYYLENNSSKVQNEETTELTIPSYQHLEFEGSLNEDLFLCSTSAIHNLIQRVTNHARQCDMQLCIKEYSMVRHAVKMNITCGN